MEVRMSDVKALLDYVKTHETKLLPFLDLSNLSYLGHSYGGMTALEACHKYGNAFKVCAAVDPVFKARSTEILQNSKFTIDQPFLMLSNEHFQSPTYNAFKEFNAWKVVSKFFDDCNAKQMRQKQTNYNLVLNGSYHIVQLDFSIHCGYLLAVFGQMGFKFDPYEKLKQTCEILLAFLHEKEVLPVDFHLEVSQATQK